MAMREIVYIDYDKCTGCGDCIPNCPEGALQVIDGKARLVNDLFCDGLGACLGHCPEDAIHIERREAEPYDEIKVMENVVRQGPNVIKAHLSHLKDHGEMEYFKQAVNYLKENGHEVPDLSYSNDFCGCPGAKVMDLRSQPDKTQSAHSDLNSELRQWPIQLHLVPPFAPYFSNPRLLIAADCTGFANPNLHQQLLKGKSVAIGCPKLDDIHAYEKKISAIIEMNDIKEITVAIMEVPCCGGMFQIVREAVEKSGKDINLEKIVVGIDGNIKSN